MESWAFFDGNGNEITRGWQGTEGQARKLARRWATERDVAVEFVAEDALLQSGDEPVDGEVVEPAEAV